MSTRRYPIFLLIAFSALVGSGLTRVAQGHDWLPQPEKASIMVISAHPD